MLIYEYKLDGTKAQCAAIDEAIRVVQFIRNKCMRLWMDERGISKNDVQCYCAVLAREYSFASRLNSQARQASADRAWFAIQRFYENCKNKKPGWVKSYAVMHGIVVVAVPPQYSSQDCSGCGERVQKTLSTRTHVCPKCGLVLDRDENAAINILAKALDGTLGHRETAVSTENASGQTASTRRSAWKTSKRAG